ncbi:hypothetical protein ACO0SA_004408 [Hanseniaspora valbyensis]
MLGNIFKRTVPLNIRPLKTVNNTRSISMLLGNRIGTFSNNLAQKQNQYTPTLKNSMINNIEQPIVSSLSPLQSLIQIVTRRFLKVNFKSSQLKKKRKFGFKARLKTNGGRKVIAKKRFKGRKYLSH